MELAIFNDCRELVEMFVQKGSTRFLVFCQQWKEMDFQHLYSMQSTNIEVMQTTAAALYIAKRIANGCGAENIGAGTGDEKMQILRRIGGIFLMYAIYFKQPTEQFVKVQSSLESWRELKSFIDTLPTVAEFDDVHYVLWKMVKSDAFRFTALDYCVGLEQLVDYDKIDGVDSELLEKKLKSCKATTSEELKQLSRSAQMMPALIILEDGYNEMKELNVIKTTSMCSKTLPPTTIFKEISLTLEHLQKLLKSETNEGKETSAVESKKRNLKRKGFKFIHSEQVNDSCKVKKRNKSYRRMSVRTVFTERLPREVLRDLQEHTDSENDNVTED